MSEQATLPTPLGAAPDLPDLSSMVTAREFHALARDGEAAGVVVAKDFEATVKPAGGPGRRLNFTLTSGSVDRDRDIIRPDGLIWEHFDANPVWLFSHQTGVVGGHPALLGVVVERSAHKRRTDVGVEYAPKEVNPLADMMYQAHLWRLDTKALGDRGGAASIGALPKEFNFDRSRGGVNFEKTEVLEGSDVMLPANRDALMRMKAAGVDLDPLGEWAAKLLDGKGLWVDLERAEAIARALDPELGMAVFEMPAYALRRWSRPAAKEETKVDPAENASADSDDPDRLHRLEMVVERLYRKVEQALCHDDEAPDPAPPPTPEPTAELTPEEVMAAMLRAANREFIARTGRPLQPTGARN